MRVCVRYYSHMVDELDSQVFLGHKKIQELESKLAAKNTTRQSDPTHIRGKSL